jgi:hypothetical protein
MPNSIISRVNKLRKDQPTQFNFTDHKGSLISDIEPDSSDNQYDLNNEDHAKIPGVDWGKIETPQIEDDTNDIISRIHGAQIANFILNGPRAGHPTIL